MAAEPRPHAPVAAGGAAAQAAALPPVCWVLLDPCELCSPPCPAPSLLSCGCSPCAHPLGFGWPWGPGAPLVPCVRGPNAWKLFPETPGNRLHPKPVLSALRPCGEQLQPQAGGNAEPLATFRNSPDMLFCPVATGAAQRSAGRGGAEATERVPRACQALGQGLQSPLPAPSQPRHLHHCPAGYKAG